MDKQVSEELGLLAADIKAKAIADAEIEARAVKESMLDKIRKAGEFLIKQAQEKAQAIIESAERWSKDAHQLMARLIKAEAEVVALKAENEALSLEREALRQQLKGKHDYKR